MSGKTKAIVCRIPSCTLNLCQCASRHRRAGYTKVRPRWVSTFFPGWRDGCAKNDRSRADLQGCFLQQWRALPGHVRVSVVTAILASAGPGSTCSLLTPAKRNRQTPTSSSTLEKKEETFMFSHLTYFVSEGVTAIACTSFGTQPTCLTSGSLYVRSSTDWPGR